MLNSAAKPFNALTPVKNNPHVYAKNAGIFVIIRYMPSISAIEDDYQSRLEQTRLEESLIEEQTEAEEAQEEMAPDKAGKDLGIFGKIKKAGKSGTDTMASQGFARGQYVLWQSMWDLCVETFGLSLFLVYVLIFSWLTKKFGPSELANKLPAPGEDGMLGFVPPPDPKTAKYVAPFYGIVNMITMFSIALILSLILLIVFAAVLVPPLFALRLLQSVLGPLGQILGRIFGGL